MSPRRVVVGVCMICALLVSAIAAQGASAVGTTAFTCKPESTTAAGFSKAHCKAADAVTKNASFVHKEIAAGINTEISGTNANNGAETTETVPAHLSVTVAGATVVITCNTVTATGTQKNVAGPPMSITGTTTVKYTGCSAPKCTVTEPIVAEANVASVHNGAGALEKGLVFTGAGAGNLFTQITLAGSECLLKGTNNITGSATGRVDGATITFNKGEDALKLGVNAADLESVVTVKGREKSTESFTPLSVTTTAS